MKIVKDGILQGIFETAYPLECMKMALCYLEMLADDMLKLTDVKHPDKIQAFIYQLKRLFGIEEGEGVSFEKAFVGRRSGI